MKVLYEGSGKYALSPKQMAAIEKFAAVNIQEAYEQQQTYIEMDDYGSHIGVKIVVAGTLIEKEDFQQ